MTDPSEKEMLDWLRKVEYLTNQDQYVRNLKEDDQKFDFLRRLIVERGELINKAAQIMAYGWELEKFARELRDFGKEGK